MTLVAISSLRVNRNGVTGVIRTLNKEESRKIKNVQFHTGITLRTPRWSMYGQPDGRIRNWKFVLLYTTRDKSAGSACNWEGIIKVGLTKQSVIVCI